MSPRDEWLATEDAALLRQCDVDTYRASGPGGQKRNKTDSAVRLRHKPSGLMAIAEESRSQHENKANALRRVRAEIALRVRAPVDTERLAASLSENIDRNGRLRITKRTDAYWTLMALLLDAVAEAGGELRAAAERMGTTTGRLSAFLTDHDKVMAEANRIRHDRGLRPMTR